MHVISVFTEQLLYHLLQGIKGKINFFRFEKSKGLFLNNMIIALTQVVGINFLIPT